MGMVLAEKPPTWLQVMHERLKHLIISSQMFKEKRKAKYNAQVKAKQTSRGKGIGKHSKGVRFLGLVEKGKDKIMPPQSNFRRKKTTSFDNRFSQ